MFSSAQYCTAKSEVCLHLFLMDKFNLLMANKQLSTSLEYIILEEEFLPRDESFFQNTVFPHRVSALE